MKLLSSLVLLYQILELQIGITANSFSLIIDRCVDDDTELMQIREAFKKKCGFF